MRENRRWRSNSRSRSNSLVSSFESSSTDPHSVVPDDSPGLEVLATSLVRYYRPSHKNSPGRPFPVNLKGSHNSATSHPLAKVLSLDRKWPVSPHQNAPSRKEEKKSSHQKNNLLFHPHPTHKIPMLKPHLFERIFVRQPIL